MRLGQLSRKLNVKSGEIIARVEKKFDVTIKDHPNCKIPDEFLVDLLSHFEDNRPSTEKELVVEEVEEKNAETPSVESVEEEKKVADSSENEAPNTNEEISASNLQEDDHELIIEEGVIKAPKPEIEGVKVVGKIDLPEPKKESEEEKDRENNETDSADSSESSDRTEEKEKTVRSRAQGKKNRPKRKTKEVLSHEEKKKREEARYRKEQEAKKKREKELKRKNYEKLMQEKAASVTSKKSSKRKKKRPTKSTKREAMKEEPKTLWGKFMRWLNT